MIKPIRIPGKVKGFFFLLRLHYLVPVRAFKFLANISDLSSWISKNRECPFNDFYTFKFDYSRREELYEHVIKTENLEEGFDYLEFGVAKGNSFKWWMNRIKSKDVRFFGFDTFSGLPENWGPFKKGDMNNGNTPPEINDVRHVFYQGLFQQTLTPFLRGYGADRRKVIHMDADLYSSTLYVLTQLTPFLKSGDILFFDEFNVPMHEFKAFIDWTSSFYVRYRVLGGVNNFYQVAIIIE
jgi:O-methyltransferase